jgi:hypothetical protein
MKGSAIGLHDVEGCLVMARRYLAIVAALVDDQGGADCLSEVRLHLVRRFAACAVLAEQMEERLVCGEQINIAEYGSLSSTLVRIAQIIGVNNRITRDLTPTLADYLAEQME